MIKDKRNLAEVMVNPRRAELIQWAEQAPEGVIIITSEEIRYEGFSSPYEALGWAHVFVPGKEDILSLLKQEAMSVHKAVTSKEKEAYERDKE